MVKFIEGLPDSVVAVEAVGKVESDDYKNVLDPAIAQAVEAHGEGRFLVVLGEEYDGFSAGAAWQDTKVGIHDRKAFDRFALVSDHHWTNDAVEVFAWLVPGEVRTYPLDELDEAKAWLIEA